MKTSDTSWQARNINASSAALQRERIWTHIAQSPDGATCDQCEIALGDLRHSSCSARIRELVKDGRLIYKGTRLTSAGCPARVYFATQNVVVTVTLTQTVQVPSRMSATELSRAIAKALQEEI